MGARCRISRRVPPQSRTLETRRVASCLQPQLCSRCNGEILPGDSARRDVGLVDGEFYCLYTCQSCGNRWREGARAWRG